MNESTNKAIIHLLFSMADDALIIGHRNSEWVGLGPILEEDIAFASIAQDKLGHALALYAVLHEHCGMEKPDNLAFMRAENDFRSCHFVELPNGEYDTSLVRHFYFDIAESLRYELLSHSTFTPLAQLSKKFRGEILYHTMHANVWIKQLSKGTEESRARIQTALRELFPFALGMFEIGENEDLLIEAGVFEGEERLKQLWLNKIQTIVEETELSLPDWNTVIPIVGGRKGYHSDYLAPLLAEMSEVLLSDPEAEW